jgi:hypothetical protein
MQRGLLTPVAATGEQELPEHKAMLRLDSPSLHTTPEQQGSAPQTQ